MNLLKGIGAILVGFLIVVALSTITDAILEAFGVFPKPGSGIPFDVTWMIILALVYRTAFTIAGGYATALLAPKPKMRYVVILGVIGILGGLAGLMATWGKGFGPVYYPVMLVILAFPSVWLGGWLKLKGKK